ncbi:FAD-binding protein [Agromyces protaetiae]|uniref:FAD-binding protein n=1 Tax=Agromyces protaetiae TaxID=2509455 RepID=A0A4P6FF86_9MICO|nr:FAD-linked oxidase C-terminal domain-containing protein [Agromyces protaetiae]QAY73059.1 FAD-binding protein [Agromyces protaetiae]
MTWTFSAAAPVIDESGASRLAARSDRSGWAPDGTPRGVVVAHDIAEVQQTLAFASEHGFPVVTRGAGSGLAGGASAGEGAIVLDLSRLDRIVSIDPVDAVAHVQPGVSAAALDAAAAEYGLRYAPDPGSFSTSTIGGNIATNAGGNRAATTGSTRDAVLALDVVLADGSLVQLGRETVRGVVGLDLVSLVVGSEGTLGAVVGATLRLTPRPVGSAVAAATFADAEAGAEASAALALAGLRPVSIELIDGRTLEAIDALRGSALSQGAGAYLLVRAEGRGAEAEIAEVAAVLAQTAIEVETTGDDERARELASVRRDALAAIEARGPAIIEDVAVPRSRLAEAIRGIDEISESLGVDVHVLAHAGDGGIHPVLRLDDDGPASQLDAARTIDAILELALRLGGTVSAEHGVGALKRRWARIELGDSVVELQRRVQAAFDPNGILNPGKAL